MAAARDIEGIGIPFAVGVAAGLAVLGNSLTSTPLSGLLLIIIIAASMLVPRLGKAYSLILIPSLFFLCGIFCAFNSSLCSFSLAPGEGLPSKAVADLRSAIDAIPYPHEESNSLVKALLTGDRSSLSKSTVDIFRQSGASHILALSGLHLGVIYLIIIRLLSPLGNSPTAKRLKGITVIAVCGFYTIMTGATPSIVRAFLFIFLNESAKLLHRQIAPIKLFAAALTIQLALAPSSMASVSFQLSYAAMLGIFLIFPLFRNMYPSADGRTFLGRIDPMRRIWESASLSISCQAFTAPLAWHYFHAFPKYFLITNLIALPMTSAIMVLSVATIALSILGICPCQLVSLNDMALQALTRCLGIISSM